MPADGSAIFRAIADYSRLRRESRAAANEMRGVQRATADVNVELGKTEQTTDRAEAGTSRWRRGVEALRGMLRRIHSVIRDNESATAVLTKTQRVAATATDTLRRRQAEHSAETDRGRNAVDRMRAAMGRLTDTNDRLGGVLRSLRNKTVVFAGLATAATASIGPVLGLVGAVVSLTGAAGLLPGVLGAVAAVAGVLKVAFSGVDEVLKVIADKDATKFEEAIRGLPPEMQRVARSAREIVPALRNIKKTIQGNFWAGLEGPLKDLAGKYLPLVHRHAGQVASTLNRAVKEFARWAGTPPVVRDVGTAMQNINTALAKLTGAVAPAAQAVLDIFVTSTDFLPRLTAGITTAVTGFAEFIRRARDTGQLKQWIQGGVDALKSLGQILFNLGRSIVAVFSAGTSAGGGFFATVADITDKLADFLSSVPGQMALASIFDAAGDAADVLLPVVKALLVAIAAVLPILVKVGEKLGPGVTKLIEGLTKAIKEAEPTFVALGSAVGDLLGAIGDAWPVVSEVIQGLAWAATPLGVLADVLRLLTAAFQAMPEPLQNATGTVIGIGIAALAAAVLLGKLAGAVKGIAATAGVGLELVGLKKAKPAVDAADAAKAGAAGGDAARKGFLARFGAGLKAGVSKLGVGAMAGLSALGRGATAAGTAMLTLGRNAGVAAAAVGRLVVAGVVAGLSALATAVKAVGTALMVMGRAAMANPIILIITAIAAIALLIILNWDTVKQWMAAFWEWLKMAAAAAWEFLKNLFLNFTLVGLVIQHWDAIKNAIGAAWDWIIEKVTGALTWVRDLVVAVWAQVQADILGVHEFIKGIILAAWDWVTAKILAVHNWIVEHVRAAWNLVTGAVRAAVDQVRGVLDNIAGFVRGGFLAAWTGLRDAVTGVWDGIKNAVGGAVDWVIRQIERLQRKLSDIKGSVGSFASTAGRALIPGFAKGGRVPGDGLAQVHSGEWVINARSSERFGPLLEAINRWSGGGATFDPAALFASLSGAASTGAALAGLGTAAGTSGTGTVNPEPTVIGPVELTWVNNYPQAEKPSQVVARRMQRMTRRGLREALDTAGGTG